MKADIKDSNVVVLEADGLIDDKHGYGFPIKQRLEENGISATIVPFAGEPEKILDLPDLPWIISGGMTEVTADIDWIKKSKSIIHERIRTNQESNPRECKPVFGICFGAQLIVEAFCPGSVRFLEDPEMGVSTINLDRPEHPLFSGMDNPFDAYSFHYNQIWSDDVTILSQHRHKGHHFLQAFEVPDAFMFGVQFHPEFTQDQMLRLFKTYKKLIAELGFDLGPVIKTLPKVSGNERLLLEFFRRYCK